MKSRVQKYRQAAAEAQQGLCYHCGLPMGKHVTAEHLQAQKDGGTDRKANIVAACFDCNHDRHAFRECADLSIPAYGFVASLARISGLRPR